MSEILYSIKEQTLTDIAEALRRKHGETEIVIETEQQVVPGEAVVFKSNNATGFMTLNGEALECQSMTSMPWHSQTKVISMPDASTIKIKYWENYCTLGAYNDGRTAVNSNNLRVNNLITSNIDNNMAEIDVTGNTVTLYAEANTNSNEAGYYVECMGYDADGNPVDYKTIDVEVEKEVQRKYSSSEMADAIDAILTVPEEALVISGHCMYKFGYGGWDWFIELYGDKITTHNITSAMNMFDSTNLESIPFELNFNGDQNVLGSIFQNAQKLKSIPKINNCRLEASKNIFYNCYRLRNLPDDITDWFDWSYMDSRTTAYQCDRGYMFQNCYSLRSVPMGFLAHANPISAYSYVYFYNGFFTCTSLDELIDLPIPYTAIYTNNLFMNTFSQCNRLKNMTFAMPNGQPYVLKWKAQIIDLTQGVGNTTDSYNVGRITNNNSGITADKEVKDDATYQALKNDPDWFTTLLAYSRYNHDSAVATINSLPDTSAYLASAGGTNTIKFKGASGSATDGGAINTLTEEEIAVATAKGWTVTLS